MLIPGVSETQALENANGNSSTSIDRKSWIFGFLLILINHPPSSCELPYQTFISKFEIRPLSSVGPPILLSKVLFRRFLLSRGLSWGHVSLLSGVRYSLCTEGTWGIQTHTGLDLKKWKYGDFLRYNCPTPTGRLFLELRRGSVGIWLPHEI